MNKKAIGEVLNGMMSAFEDEKRESKLYTELASDLKRFGLDEALEMMGMLKQYDLITTMKLVLTDAGYKPTTETEALLYSFYIDFKKVKKRIGHVREGRTIARTEVVNAIRMSFADNQPNKINIDKLKSYGKIIPTSQLVDLRG